MNLRELIWVCVSVVYAVCVHECGWVGALVILCQENLMNIVFMACNIRP